MTDTLAFDSGDGFLAYRDTGAGRPVVLLHGAFADFTMWDDQVSALARNYRVIAPDARGHGGSANATRPFRQCDDLAALLRHLDLGPAVLVGLSMGAMIAVDTALEHPELVHALLISGRGAGNPDLTDPWAEEVHEAQARALGAGDLPGWLDAFVRWAAGPSRSVEQIDPDIVRRLKEMAVRTLTKHTPDETDFSVKVADTVARAKEISVPVLAANGALDAPGLLETVAAVMNAVPDGHTTAVEGAAHYPNMEQPEAFNRIVEDFLASVYARGAVNES